MSCKKVKNRKCAISIKKRSSDVLKNNLGTTMVETLVSFVVLMIVLAALYAMFRFSANLRMRAIDTANVRTEFNGEIYKTNPDTSKVTVYKYIGKREQDHTTMFMLKLNDKTTDANLSNSTGSGIEKDSFKQSIRVPNIDATGYVSKDSRITEENLATPKVLVFKFYKTPESD